MFPEFDTRDQAERFLQSIPPEIQVVKTDESEDDLIVRPFNTPDLLREAAVQLRFSPQKTMQLAQELFEQGRITYHRTDSHRISPVGMHLAKEYITEYFGEQLVKLRPFDEGGAHEAIRATTTMDRDDLQSFLLSRGMELSDDHLRLYDLIFRRFIASQMKETRVLKERFRILDVEKEFITRILERGFDLIYPVHITEIREGTYPADKILTEKSKYPPYTYADIIQKMKDEGIGRPSTYAVTLEKLLQRKYVVERKGFLFATKLGFKVNDLVYQSPFKDFVSVDFTARLENIMDEIEAGKRDYKAELERLYDKIFSSEGMKE